jgi:biotin-(acetyl-CoA carboxylase) ligase
LTPADIEPLVIEGVERAAQATSHELANSERARFGQHDWLLGRSIAQPVAGVATGIDADGHLLVRQPGGIHVVVTGPIVPDLAPDTAHT